MSANKSNISQIRKYLNGELDARAMHKLERQAQDDPFLMDAMEGYTGRKDQQANLDDLQQRLQRRVAAQPRKRMVMWPVISVAATVLVFISIGAWWILVYQPSATRQAVVQADHTAVNIRPAAPPAKSAEPPMAKKENAVLSPAGPKEVIHQQVLANNVISNKPKLDKRIAQANVPAYEPNAEIRIDEPVGKSEVKMATQDTVQQRHLAEVTVEGYQSQRKKAITGSVPAVTETVLQGKVAGVQITSPEGRNGSLRDIVGLVRDESSGEGLPGVTVKVVDKDGFAVTDSKGQFKIGASKDDQLSFGYIGYKPQKLKVGNKDSINVALEESASSLNEVVTIGYGTRKNITTKAHPAVGWDSFNKYIADHAQSPDGVVGTVKVTFIVNPDNGLSDFKIVKSLSGQADAAAINLIKNGPAWLHHTNGKPQAVTVKIKFKK